MNAAASFPHPELSAEETALTAFRAFFEYAPIAAARCDAQGVIAEMNSAFESGLALVFAGRSPLRLAELVPPYDRDRIELRLRELFNSDRDSSDHKDTARPSWDRRSIDLQIRSAGNGSPAANFILWRQPGCGGEPDYALILAQAPAAISFDESSLQTGRWEAIGRLTGGVVHDFNNLLTGVMLYCDLLLSSLDSRDCRRRYADEIRTAIVQSAALVQQLLVFARPQAVSIRTLSLNHVAQAMQSLLGRLIGENIALHFQLDAGLAEVKIDQAQAQQILLNLILNARDALPNGGTITIETRNCRFQPVAGSQPESAPPAFPCVLLAVQDNGNGMTAETRRRIFEPFFTTKSAGQGTGLGLTTVRSIVTTNRGLIHFESEPGRGTRVMILLPQASSHSAGSVLSDTLNPDTVNPDSSSSPLLPFQQLQKESLL